MDRVIEHLLFKVQNIFSKGYTENWSREMYPVDSLLKANPCTYKIKYLKAGKITGSF